MPGRAREPLCSLSGAMKHFQALQAALRCGPGPAFIGINLDWETCAHLSKRVSRKQSPFFLLGKPHPSLWVFPLIVRGNLRVT